MATPYGDFERFRKMIEAWSKQFAPLARQFEALANPPALRRIAEVLNSVNRQWNFLEQLRPKIDWDKVQDWWKRGLPPNWIEVEPRLDASDVLAFMRETRWCLVWVPRGEVVRRLVDAEEDNRSDELLASAPEIIEDSRSVLQTIEHPDLQQCRRAARSSGGNRLKSRHGRPGSFSVLSQRHHQYKVWDVLQEGPGQLQSGGSHEDWLIVRPEHAGTAPGDAKCHTPQAR